MPSSSITSFLERVPDSVLQLLRPIIPTLIYKNELKGMSNKDSKLAIWFLTVRTGTGTDVFTERLVEGLRKRGIRAEITWLPLRAEYLPWTIAIPKPPKWATLVHVNTWLHHRFLPKSLPVNVATLHHSVHDPKLQPYKGLLRACITNTGSHPMNDVLCDKQHV